MRIPPATPQANIVEICTCIQSMAQGRTHAKGTFTITTSSATTTVTDANVKVGDVILFTPQDAAAATKIAAGGFFIAAVSASDASSGQFTVTHANDGTAGTIGYIIQGE